MGVSIIGPSSRYLGCQSMVASLHRLWRQLILVFLPCGVPPFAMSMSFQIGRTKFSVLTIRFSLNRKYDFSRIRYFRWWLACPVVKLSIANLARFFSSKMPRAATSVKPTCTLKTEVQKVLLLARKCTNEDSTCTSVFRVWLQRSSTRSTIDRTTCIARAKPVEINRTLVFHPFLETTP
jgi:hypothetical protein